jgi:hypothetical protein
MAFAKSDSVAPTRFAAEADDGTAETRAGVAFLQVPARRGGTGDHLVREIAAVLDLDLGACSACILLLAAWSPVD